ncbi:MAG: hypothetical protein M4579_007295 [Chaenotheca gracillima]|nr:MAG: hypothetical protein M4579_007295 [Chaenotheca gracillima]
MRGYSALVMLQSVTSLAHSWVEELTAIGRNGTQIGNAGFARGNVARTDPQFTGDVMTHLLPPNTRPVDVGILASDLMCSQTQMPSNQSTSNPRLQVTRDATEIVFWYEENGHVTLPQIPVGKPLNRGTIYIYGTQNATSEERFNGIHKVWNASGTGGDRHGKLLATFDFDDGYCYQINDGAISRSRQQQYPHQPQPPMGADRWCRNILSVPGDAQQMYTFYWVWDWLTAANVDPDLPSGKTEIYTTCIDVDFI